MTCCDFFDPVMGIFKGWRAFHVFQRKEVAIKGSVRVSMIVSMKCRSHLHMKSIDTNPSTKTRILVSESRVLAI